MSRLLLFNLATDADDPVLGFTTVWINALAAHYDAVDVLTMRAGRLALADNVNVYSVGKERGFSEAHRAINFYRILPRLLRQYDYTAGFAHMQPLFAIMAAPLLKPRHIPLTLWYAHGSVTRRLRLAEKLVDRVVTSSPGGFRLKSDKVIYVGQGIDTDVFQPAASAPSSPFTIVSAGRISPVKRLEGLIDAAMVLAQQPGIPPFIVRLYGEAVPDYQRKLRQMAAPQPEIIDFAGPVTYDQMPAIYQQAHVMVNLSATGSVDKAVLEAMACGLPVITANEAFMEILNPWADLLLVAPDDAYALAQRLEQVAAMTAAERARLGQTLRELVIHDHSLRRLTDKLVSVLARPS